MTSDCGPGKWRVVAGSQEEEDQYDLVKHRNVKFVSTFGSIAHLVKGALGAGLLGGPWAYMRAGLAPALPSTLLFGAYLCCCFYLLVSSAQTLCRRTRVPHMSYSDVCEASVACFHSRKVARFSTSFRYIADAVISIDLFGSCACYHIIIAKSIKQLIEGSDTTHEITSGNLSLRVYLAVLIIPLILICLIRHLKYLAPFSIIANMVILLCLVVTIYYAKQLNPTFEGLVSVRSGYGFFQFAGVNIFSMSCIGIVIPVEGNMRNPHKFPLALVIGMSIIVLSTIILSFFGYVAFLDECQSPITVNYPMTLFPKILKGLISIMIYVTYALNFWVPFNLLYYYISKRITTNEVAWEMFYRAMFVILVALIAIMFPDINALMGFIGCLCLSNMAFIWPSLIYVLTVWERPGLGYKYWRLWTVAILGSIGLFIMIAGSIVNGIELYNAFFNSLNVVEE